MLQSGNSFNSPLKVKGGSFEQKINFGFKLHCKANGPKNV